MFFSKTLLKFSTFYMARLILNVKTSSQDIQLLKSHFYAVLIYTNYAVLIYANYASLNLDYVGFLYHRNKSTKH